MARCGTCGNAVCACRVYQDGAVLLVNADGTVVPANPDSREGRRTTVVTGNGTAGSPYEISFIDSLEYRPQAAELRRDTADAAGGVTGDLIEFEFILYNTPSDNKILYHEPVGFASDANVNNVEWLFFGASARFSGGALGQNKMMIEFIGKDDVFVGGHTSEFRSGRTITELTAGGLIDPLMWQPAGQSGGFVGVFRIRYTSVDPLVNARFWVATT